MVNQLDRREDGTGQIIRDADDRPIGVRAPDAQGKRPRMYFYKDRRPVSEADAVLLAPVLAQRAKGMVQGGLTVSEWWKLYMDAAEAGRVGRKSKGKPQITTPLRRARFRDYIEPVIGKLPMTTVSSEQLRAIVQKLDAEVHLRGRFYSGEVGAVNGGARHTSKPGLSGKTAALVWSEVTSAFKEACSSKITELKVRADGDNPASSVQGPDRTEKRDQAALYPSEVVRLLSCMGVPLERRRLYALALYTGLRLGELKGLRGKDIDYEHAVIYVRRQERGDVVTARMKTRAGRRSVPLMPQLVPLLQVMVDGDKPLITKLPPREDTAMYVRKDLVTAGVDREDLFTDDDVRQHFTFHGLRHTAITHWAVSGKEMTWLMHAAGHTAPSMTQQYIDKGSAIRGSFGEPHPQLPHSLIAEEKPGRIAGPEAGPQAGNHPKNLGKTVAPPGVELLSEQNPAGFSPPTGLLEPVQTRLEPPSRAQNDSVETALVVAIRLALVEHAFDLAHTLVDALRDHAKSVKAADVIVLKDRR